jgi:hypothetical protein
LRTFLAARTAVTESEEEPWPASTSAPTAGTGRGGGSTPADPRRPASSPRKGDAQLFLDAIRGDLAHGLYVDPAGGRTLFRDYAEEWRSTQVHRSGTATQIETYSGSTRIRRSDTTRSAPFAGARSKPG